MAEDLGGLDLLMNNASTLGLSPRPLLADYPIDELLRVYEVNALAPLALFQRALPLLRGSAGRVINVTSDAAVEGYPGWEATARPEAALEQVSHVLAAEHPELRIYWVDPGDMNTQMQQDAFPGEDVSDRLPQRPASPASSNSSREPPERPVPGSGPRHPAHPGEGRQSRVNAALELARPLRIQVPPHLEAAEPPGTEA